MMNVAGKLNDLGPIYSNLTIRYTRLLPCNHVGNEVRLIQRFAIFIRINIFSHFGKYRLFDAQSS